MSEKQQFLAALEKKRRDGQSHKLFTKATLHKTVTRWNALHSGVAKKEGAGNCTMLRKYQAIRLNDEDISVKVEPGNAFYMDSCSSKCQSRTCTMMRCFPFTCRQGMAVATASVTS